MRTNEDGPVDIERIRGYFSDPKTVEHYLRAVANIGLWESEKAVFEKWLDRRVSILDLGCGAGRIAFGLWKLGYRKVQGADLSQEMVAEARSIANCMGVEIPFFCEDATGLSFASEQFEAVVFGFNGLMQIPGRANRRKALREVRRILVPGKRFVFTTLDREDPLYRSVFSNADDFEHDLDRNPLLIDLGDRHFDTSHGTTFMHVPARDEVLEDLKSTGWIHLADRMRSEIADEPDSVVEFAENCRFWIVEKPAR